MSPDEVIEKLKKIGIDMSRPTLTRYEKQGLIPTPKRGGTGRGGGRWTDYPNETVVEAYASWSLIHGVYAAEELKAVFEGKPPKISPFITNLARLLYFADLRKKTIRLELYSAMNEQVDDNKTPSVINEKYNLAEEAYNEILHKIPEKAQALLKWLSSIWRDELYEANKLLKTLK